MFVVKVLIVLISIFIVIALFGSNPSEADFANYIGYSIYSGSDSLLEALAAVVVGKVSQYMTDRDNYILFSIYTLRLGDHYASYLGLLNHFVLLSASD